MKHVRRAVLVAVVLLSVAPNAWSQVTSISASPDVINQDIGETSTIIVEGAPGLANFEVHLLNERKWPPEISK